MSLDVKQLRVVPDIFLARGDQEPPTLRQREIRHDLGQALRQMSNVKRLEEVPVVGIVAAPDVPPVVSPSGGCRSPWMGPLVRRPTPALRNLGDGEGSSPYRWHTAA